MVRKMEEIIKAKAVEGILFFSKENIRYITQFCGEEAVLYFSKEKKTLFVDPRYFEQAQTEAKGCEVYLVKEGIKEIGRVLKGWGVKQVGIEAQAVTVATFWELKKQEFELHPLVEELEDIRAVKETWEIEQIVEALRLAEGAFLRILELVKPGISERDLALEFEYLLKKMGAEDVAFSSIVLTGPRTSLPHGKPTDRKLQWGEPLLFDFGAVFKGYCSDQTRTLLFGPQDPELKKIFSTVKEAQRRAIEAIRPGVPCSEVDRIAREYLQEAGYGDFFGHGTGHGIGLAVHEAPSLSPRSRHVLQKGMVVTVEPGVYIPGLGGVRIEDLVLVEENGPRVLSSLAKEVVLS